MLGELPAQPEDEIIGLMQAFRADPRPDKIDLGVGVYRDEDGRTPVMRAVRAAGRLLWEGETTKAYVGLLGDPVFCAEVERLVLADAAEPAGLASGATNGGTGAVRMAFDMARLAAPGGRIWLTDPTWPNHAVIAAAIGAEVVPFRYYDPATGGVDTEGMLAALGKTRAGDLVVLHGACHNPTGADLDAEGWDAVAAVLDRTGATPLVDLAYQGFGAGIEADAAGLRRLVRALPEVMVAVSGSKSFGVYRDRAGALLVQARDGAARDLARANMAALNRQACSFPPDHGARLVSLVLGDAILRADWEDELDAMRHRLVELRGLLAEELRRQTNSDRFDALARQRGMFSRLPLRREQIERLRGEQGIYLIGDGRMNVAGLSRAAIPGIAAAIASLG